MRIAEITSREPLVDEAVAQSADQQRLRALKVNADRAKAAAIEATARKKVADAQKQLTHAKKLRLT